MNIHLTVEQMQRLLTSGVIHPSEIECLDLETRNELKALCLKLCKPKQCQRCAMQTLCQSVTVGLPISQPSVAPS